MKANDGLLLRHAHHSCCLLWQSRVLCIPVHKKRGARYDMVVDARPAADPRVWFAAAVHPS